MKTHVPLLRAVLALLLAVPIASCSRAPADPSAPAAKPDSAHAAEAHEHGEEGAEAEVSDLDRPVEELFAARCEHDLATHACDECRYEVGVAKAPAALFQEGLLSTVRAVREPVAVALRLTGEVSFDERRVAHLGAPGEGTIEAVHVALGDRVARGRPLIRFVSRVAGEAQAAWLEAQAALRLARADHARAKDLHDEGISSDREFQQAAQQLEAAEIRADAARRELARLGIPLPSRTAAATSGRLELRAPAAGTVLALHAVPGEIGREAEPLVTIGDASTVWVWADVYERDLAAVQALRGRPARATVTVNAFPGERFPGTVALVGPAMDERSRTARLRVEVGNPAGRLLSGMFAEVSVLVPGRERALALPAGAVLEDEGRHFVFVRHHGDFYVRRPVTVGRTWGDRVEVLGGLADGGTVVAQGAFLMKSDVLRSKMGAGCAD